MPTLTPVPNIRSQLERAVRAWLMDCNVGTYAQFFLSHNSNVRKVIAPDGSRIPAINLFAVSAQENPTDSRVERWQLRIDPEWDGVTQPNDAGPNGNWVAINNLTGLVMAAMSQTIRIGGNYYSTALMISVLGRRLAVLGAIGDPSETSATDNADMALFYCDFVKYIGATGVKQAPQGGLVFLEERNFTLDACNLSDDSIFPILTFDNVHTLNWTFTATETWPEPAQWNVEKSVDGVTWVTADTLASGSRSQDITGTGTQFWRVTRTDASIPNYMPESNIVSATAP